MSAKFRAATQATTLKSAMTWIPHFRDLKFFLIAKQGSRGGAARSTFEEGNSRKKEKAIYDPNKAPFSVRGRLFSSQLSQRGSY